MARNRKIQSDNDHLSNRLIVVCPLIETKNNSFICTELTRCRVCATCQFYCLLACLFARYAWIQSRSQELGRQKWSFFRFNLAITFADFQSFSFIYRSIGRYKSQISAHLTQPSHSKRTIISCYTMLGAMQSMWRRRNVFPIFQFTHDISIRSMTFEKKNIPISTIYSFICNKVVVAFFSSSSASLFTARFQSAAVGQASRQLNRTEMGNWSRFSPTAHSLAAAWWNAPATFCITQFWIN